MQKHLAFTSAVCSLVLAAEILFAQNQAATTAPAGLRFTVGRETTVITAPLKAAKSVDYVAALNERYGKGVTSQNNGFVLYLRAAGTDRVLDDPETAPQILKMCDAKPSPEQWTPFNAFLATQNVPDAELSDARAELGELDAKLWSEKEHPRLAAYLKLQEPKLKLMVEAASRLHWWAPSVATSDALLYVALPSLGAMREIAQSLGARALLRINSHDFDGYLADVMALKMLARRIGNTATIIERLVAVAMETISTQAIGVPIAAGLFNDAQLQKIRQALAAMPVQPGMVEAVDVEERWRALDLACYLSLNKQWTPMADANSMGGLGTIQPSQIQFDIVLKDINRYFDEVVAAMREPTFEAVKKREEAILQKFDEWQKQRAQHDDGRLWIEKNEKAEAYSERVARALIAWSYSGFAKPEELYRRARQELRCLDALLAIANWKNAHGGWPKALNDLPADLQKELPADEFAPGQKIRYVLTPKGPYVYSFGVNGKDDGGHFDRVKLQDDQGAGARPH